MSHPWTEVALGDIAKPAARTISVVPGKSYRTIGVKWWGEGAYERETIDGSRTAARTLSVVCQGDLIINKIWVRHGSIAIASQAVDGCAASGEFPTFELSRDRVVPEWIHWQTKTRAFWAKCDELSRGTSGKNRIKPELFLTIRVALAPLAEQRRIVARIEELAAQIHGTKILRQQSFEEAEALLKAHLNRLFGNPYEGKAGRLGIKEWRRMTEVVDDVADGPHVTPRYVEEGVPFITVLNITSGRISFDHHKFITPEDHVQFAKRAKAAKGDVLITKDGTIGVPCLVDTDREFSFFVSVALIKPKQQVLDGAFLAWALRTPYLQVRMAARSRGDMIRHLVLREIRELLVPVPKLLDQQRVVTKLDALQAEVHVLKHLQTETATELDALLPAILDRAFKGEL